MRDWETGSVILSKVKRVKVFHLNSWQSITMGIAEFDNGEVRTVELRKDFTCVSVRLNSSYEGAIRLVRVKERDRITRELPELPGFGAKKN
ncbi:hypothetical protein ACFU99_00820 [Streptomyces sp. NPDC057654]|uniref:hypothetical protein n=1 Tax=Streptomyces sp. NPDC057654 TaxID=3346196 RepID=UPI0036A9348F